MLDLIVRYLHEAMIPFRLSSYPSMEHLPKAVQPLPKHAVLVESQIVLIGDKLALLCFVASDQVDLSALANELDAAVIDATEDDLPEALKRGGAPPPLGQLFGLPVIVDERVTRAGSVVFQPFGESDFVELPYDDYARQEQPRVASFVRAGELPEHAAAKPATPAR
ncbi:MAG: YbaK/EbsC family protein [Labilithrix sp.]|nr:YbaK/EbsC family protein [Labilithrix sp.]MBX3222641.1 YbaK/EbsC family protein [Labilithrix sp.]